MSSTSVNLKSKSPLQRFIPLCWAGIHLDIKQHHKLMWPTWPLNISMTVHCPFVLENGGFHFLLLFRPDFLESLLLPTFNFRNKQTEIKTKQNNNTPNLLSLLLKLGQIRLLTFLTVSPQDPHGLIRWMPQSPKKSLLSFLSCFQWSGKNKPTKTIRMNSHLCLRPNNDYLAHVTVTHFLTKASKIPLIIPLNTCSWLCLHYIGHANTFPRCPHGLFSFYSQILTHEIFLPFHLRIQSSSSHCAQPWTVTILTLY